MQRRIEDVNTPVSLSLNDTLTLEVKVENLEVDYIEGYLGQQTSSIGPQALDFSYNQDLPFESLNFERIDVGISFENEIGVPAQLIIKQLDFQNLASESRKFFFVVVSEQEGGWKEEIPSTIEKGRRETSNKTDAEGKKISRTIEERKDGNMQQEGGRKEGALQDEG